MIEALEFATEMHEGQVRKYTGEEYIMHPIAVADLVEEYLDEQEEPEEFVMAAIAIALLHDTVEDTPATEENILERFGAEIAEGVWYLTKTPSFVGNRAFRKKLCEARLSQAPYMVRVIKTFDMFHNSLSIQEHDPKFWELFQQETVELLEAMGTQHIFEEAKSRLAYNSDHYATQVAQ